MNRWLQRAIICMVALFGPAGPAAHSQDAAGAKPVIPNYWDLRHRPPAPELGTQKLIRFLTDEDYPPFHFLGPDGQLTGFNVELARAMCEVLKITCTIQSRRWDTLVSALDQNQGDAIIASLAITAESRKRLGFAGPYYRTPARFLTRNETALASIAPDDLRGKTVGVVAGSAHEAYLRLFFPDAVTRSYPDNDATREALKRGDVEVVFGDGVGLAIWLASAGASGCCHFAGGPYLESRFFGEGVGIALRPQDVKLRQALDFALIRVWESGAYANLYLKYFPVGFF